MLIGLRIKHYFNRNFLLDGAEKSSSWRHYAVSIASSGFLEKKRDIIMPSSYKK
jgi:hypothetical protein